MFFYDFEPGLRKHTLHIRIYYVVRTATRTPAPAPFHPISYHPINSETIDVTVRGTSHLLRSAGKPLYFFGDFLPSARPHCFQASAPCAMVCFDLIRFHVKIQDNKNKTIQSSQALVDNKPCLCPCLDRAKPGCEGLAEYSQFKGVTERKQRIKQPRKQSSKQLGRQVSKQA